jgi:hypothetical protein
LNLAQNDSIIPQNFVSLIIFPNFLIPGHRLAGSILVAWPEIKRNKEDNYLLVSF